MAQIIGALKGDAANVFNFTCHHGQKHTKDLGLILEWMRHHYCGTLGRSFRYMSSEGLRYGWDWVCFRQAFIVTSGTEWSLNRVLRLFIISTRCLQFDWFIYSFVQSTRCGCSQHLSLMFQSAFKSGYCYHWGSSAQAPGLTLGSSLSTNVPGCLIGCHWYLWLLASHRLDPYEALNLRSVCSWQLHGNLGCCSPLLPSENSNSHIEVQLPVELENTHLLCSPTLISGEAWVHWWQKLFLLYMGILAV